MDRRTFLKSATGAGLAVASGGLAMPALAQSASKTLRFVPQANLANFDPIWGTQYVVRNAAALVWDTLYGVDSKFQPQRQMVESEEVSSDGLTWTFKLRSGLKFHDGSPVTSKDVVASLVRWSARDPMGLMLRAIQVELSPVDELTWKWVLKEPYPKMLLALAKNNAPCTFIMPERIAKTDPFTQITEYVGSGPMKFLKSDWVPAPRRSSRNSRTTSPAARRRTGSPAARTSWSTASSGSSFPTPRRPPPPCRAARWTGGRPRWPTSCPRCATTRTSTSISATRSAISAPSA